MNKPYIRRKGNKFIIERKVGKKTEYLWTLPDALDLLKLGRPDVFKRIASDYTKRHKKKPSEKFAHELLNEPAKKDAPDETGLSDDDIMGLFHMTR